MKLVTQARKYGAKAMSGVDKAAVAAALAMGTVLSANAAATTIDTTDVLLSIAAAVVAIVAVGGAVLGLQVAVKAFKWVRAAMS
ncbi:Bacteriophage coat protein B [Rhodoferax sp. OV413]|uniref:major capsid protein n=1 Tax=Rhodoferax sp. OV413 TaxID=1855285 RepID=UPI00088DC245|nr:major capsid protein [Rhodoferax sp. OV413]SDO08082.1 Bacteriophage coat protein B [Rhodoferax sp. OV413]